MQRLASGDEPGVRWQAAALASGAVVILGGVAAAATLLPHDHPHDVKKIVSEPSPAASPTATLASSPAPPPNPLRGDKFYVDPQSAALQAAHREANPTQRVDLMRIGAEPQAFWYGDWVPASNITSEVGTVVRRATSANRVPVLVTYDIPVRDCHGYSGGGATSPAAYRSWIDGFANGIGTRSAVVILEPDALAQLDCLSQADQQTRLSLLRYAVGRLTQHKDTTVYLDAGHSGWIDAGTMAQRLQAAGVRSARGFALNVSNFGRTADEVTYGHEVGAAIGIRTPFVIDTSRNGLGPSADNAWCNPPGRALGASPTADTGREDVDAFLWIKRPGESDGTCKGGPNAGQFWTSYAIGLAEASSSRK